MSTRKGMHMMWVWQSLSLWAPSLEPDPPQEELFYQWASFCLQITQDRIAPLCQGGSLRRAPPHTRFVGFTYHASAGLRLDGRLKALPALSQSCTCESGCGGRVLDMWHYSSSCLSIWLIQRLRECVFLTHRKLVQAGKTVSIDCHDMLITCSAMQSHYRTVYVMRLP